MSYRKISVLSVFSIACLLPSFSAVAQENVAPKTTTVNVVKQETALQGLIKQSNGKWYYFVDGKQDTTFSGLFKHTTGIWYYVVRGEVAQTFSGLVQHQTNKRWFYVKNGEIDWTYTGLAQHQTNKRWFYVKNGEIDWKFTDLVQYSQNKGWYYVKNGEIDWTFTGLVQYSQNKRWFYVKNGKIDWSFTNVVQHVDNNGYYVKNGEIDWKFTGTLTFEGKPYEITNGKVIKRDLTPDKYVDVSFAIEGIVLMPYKERLPQKDVPLQVAVWSDVNGQDDLRWYTLSQATTIPYTNHKGIGKYHIHVYQQQPEVFKGLQSLAVDFPKNSPKVSIQSKNQLTYQVVVENVPDYLTKVLVPVWSELYGQDDLIWYTAVKKGKGRYELDIPLGNHQLTEGQYHVHVYATNQLTNQQELLEQTNGFHTGELPIQSGVAVIGALDLSTISLPVTIQQAAHQKGLQHVKVAVWSTKNGQDDLVWYTSEQKSAGHYVTTIDFTRHQLLSDTYQIHVYLELKDGEMILLSEHTKTVTLPSLSQLSATIQGVGGHVPSVSIRNALSNEIQKLHNLSYKVGFVLFDTQTQKGIMYNANERFYSASTIKGPYMISALSADPTLHVTHRSLLEGIAQYSSNEGYVQLRGQQGHEVFRRTLSYLDMDTTLANAYYTYLSANELGKLWMNGYNFIMTAHYVGELFEKPNLSPIRSMLSSQYKTQTKAGWIGEPPYYRAASDAGIVYTNKGNYVLAIMTNADGQLYLLNDIVKALDSAYQEIK